MPSAAGRLLRRAALLTAPPGREPRHPTGRAARPKSRVPPFEPPSEPPFEPASRAGQTVSAAPTAKTSLPVVAPDSMRPARLVADAAGVDDPAAVAALALSGRRLPPWPDTVAGLARLAERFPLIGLSNASRTALLGLNPHAGLRWHQALSAEDARAYKPDPAVYQLAVAVSGRPPERLLMVAAHAWDLRGAQGLGLRTAYVARPVGDPPTSSDRFDLHADGLADLADQLDRAS
ncbi:haloacid dehalogenase type II [Streptomyces sp. NPDC048650]|uniref:haloacid dehalogenase type II n=1 Tax=Streptomyces sp. NPDC048650 TaxID=3365583 RepID=UPI003720FB75